jgi:integrase/recombinase XerD
MWGKGVTVKFIIDSELVLLRAPEGPLAAYIKRFAESLSEQGYTLDSIHRQVFIAACFSQWLKRQGVALRSIRSEHPPCASVFAKSCTAVATIPG